MTSPFLLDDVIQRNEVRFRVIGSQGSETVQLQNLNSGEFVTVPSSSLLEEFVNGKLKVGHPMAHAQDPGSRGRRRAPARMDGMSDADRFETRRRIDFLVRLERMGSFHGTRAVLENDIKEISTLRGEKYAPHRTTIFAWRRKYLKSGQDIRALFSCLGDRGGEGSPRLCPEVEGALLFGIEDALVRSKTWTAETILDAIREKIRLLNLERGNADQVLPPSLRTVQRRLARWPAYDLAVARYGVVEADRRFALHGNSRHARNILELVEIDHTPVDLMVVDEDGVCCGRPMMTTVLDRKSRVVLGYHLSLAGHGTAAVFQALRHAFLPKTYLKTRYSDLALEWPAFGWPSRVLMDNGREFHSKAVEDALANLGIVSEFSGSRQPNDKPFVERFQRTFNYSFIHRLPGTTLAKIHLRVGFKAEDDAALTLEKLDLMIHVWICQVYHLRPHSGLGGRAPIVVWKEGANVRPPQLKANVDDLEIELGVPGESALQHYGIDLNTFVYTSPKLLQLRALLPERERVRVKWSTNNVGHIHVWDRLAGEFIKVANKEAEFDGMSLHQARAVKARRAAGDPDFSPVRATAATVLNDLIDEQKADKALKKRRAASKLEEASSRTMRDGVGGTAPVDPGIERFDVPRGSGDVPEFDVEVAVDSEVPQ